MCLHVLDQHGRTLFDKGLPAGPDTFRAAVAPFRQGSSSAASETAFGTERFLGRGLRHGRRSLTPARVERAWPRMGFALQARGRPGGRP